MTQQKLLCEMTVIHADHGKGKKKSTVFPGAIRNRF